MPIYEYQCRKCGTFEHSQSIKDKPLSKCPQCRRAVTKLVSASSFHLKGGGWYPDGYAKKAGGTESATVASEKKKPADTAAKPGAKDAGSSKPASGTGTTQAS